MGERAAMGGRLGRFLQRIERTCADVAIDDAERAQCGDNRKTFGVCRFTWVRNSHCFPRSAFFRRTVCIRPTRIASGDVGCSAGPPSVALVYVLIVQLAEKPAMNPPSIP